MSYFDTSYNLLNKKQKEAVDTINGPVMVIAGPGTGKTSILTLRVANILKNTDTPPESILVLTFTDAGVKAIKEKLEKYLGNRAYEVSVFTFHSFCSYLQERYVEYFEDYIDFSLITEVEQIQCFENILMDNEFKYIKTNRSPFYFLLNIISEIKTIKREGISVDLFSKYVKKQKDSFYSDDDIYNKKTNKIKTEFLSTEKRILRSEELIVVYKEYQKYLDERSLKDYEDILIFTINTLEKNREFLQILQEEYQYLLADEHQDANNAQNRIIELLSSYDDNPNLFIVGDEKQAIYRFQGASLENFMYFKNKYKGATVIQLDTNYRSTQNVLDNAFTLIKNNKVADQSLIVNLKSVNEKENEKIEIHDFYKKEDQLKWVAEEIKSLIDDAVSPNEIAIIFRKNSEINDMTKILSYYKIPYNFDFQKNILESKEASFFLNLFLLIEEPNNKEAFVDFLSNSYSGISLLDVLKMNNSLKERYPEDFIKSKDFEELNFDNKEKILEIVNQIKDLRRYAKDHSVPEFLDEVIRYFEVIDKVYNQEEGLKNLKILKAVYNEIKNISINHKKYSLKDIVDYFRLAGEYQLKIKVSVGTKKGVSIQVAHQTKGLEYDYVFIANLANGIWDSRRSNKYFESVHPKVLRDQDDEDERRLFYVALTRARKKVFCSYSRFDENNKEKIPSKFISELDPNLIKKVKHDEEDNSEFYIPDKENKNSTDELLAILPDLYLSKSLSVSAVNKYLTCPWQFIFTNILKVPKSYTWSQIYGQAMHSALKDFFDKAVKDNKLPNKKVLIDSFEFYAKKSFLSDKEIEEMIKEGSDNLSGYYDTYKDSWQIKDIITEQKISSVDFVINDKNKIKLTGNLDKVEYKDSSNCTVIDYKTGKPKSQAEVEGQTKNSDGNFKRQLLFYKLLLKHKGINMQSGSIDFLNPNPSGKFKKITVSLEESDLDELEDTIRVMSEEILSGSWIKNKCKEKYGQCQWCKKARERNYLESQ